MLFLEKQLKAAEGARVAEKRSICLFADAMLSGTMLVDEIHTPKHRKHVHEKKEVEEEGDVQIGLSHKSRRYFCEAKWPAEDGRRIQLYDQIEAAAISRSNGPVSAKVVE